MITIHEQADGQPLPDNAVEVRTDMRSSKIIKGVFLGHEDDPFCKVSLAAIKASAERGLPVTANLCGNPDRGRISIIANSVCSMVTAELTNIEGGELDNMIAEVAKFDIEGKRIAEEDHNGRTILQLSINTSALMNLLGAIISANNPTFSQGCELISGQYLIDPDGNDEDQDNTDPQDIDHGGEVPTSEGLHENQIPFPAKPELSPVN